MKIRVRNTKELQEVVAEKISRIKDPGIEQQVSTVLNDIEVKPVYMSDKWIYRMVIIGLSLIVLITVLGVTIAFAKNASTEKELIIPTVLVSLTSTAIGALTGLLTPSPRQADN